MFHTVIYCQQHTTVTLLIHVYVGFFTQCKFYIVDWMWRMCNCLGHKYLTFENCLSTWTVSPTQLLFNQPPFVPLLALFCNTIALLTPFIYQIPLLSPVSHFFAMFYVQIPLLTPFFTHIPLFALFMTKYHFWHRLSTKSHFWHRFQPNLLLALSDDTIPFLALHLNKIPLSKPFVCENKILPMAFLNDTTHCMSHHNTALIIHNKTSPHTQLYM